ncbi:MAG: serine hydrolase domain-containing protein [Steroidobacteraceae bacterium]
MIARILFIVGIVLAASCRLDFFGHDFPRVVWTGLQAAAVLWLVIALVQLGKAPLLAIPALLLLYLFPLNLAHLEPAGIPNEPRLLTYLRANNVVGASVGMHVKGRQYFAGYGGVRKFGARPTPHTQYQIASVTKIFTGHVLSENFDAALVPLATHSSGLPDITQGVGFPLRFLLHPFDYYAHYDAEDLARDLVNFEEPGKRHALPKGKWRYSNIGFCLLGRELRMHERRFGNISYERSEQLAAGYNAAGVRTALWSAGVCHGAGGLHASAADLLDHVRRPSAAKEIYSDDGEHVMGLGWMFRDGIWYHSGATFGNTAFVAHEPISDTAVVILVSGVA